MKVLVSILFLLMISAYAKSKKSCLSCIQQNIVGERLKVSYVDYGKIVKSWVIEDGKVTTGVTENGIVKGYYYFYSTDGYIQIPIGKAMIEELKD